MEVIIEAEEIDLLCFAGCRADPRERSAPHQHVQQRGFPDIGSPCEGDFGEITGRELVRMCRADNKLRPRGL